jgi:16S rRNA (guanine966-N2)-methyltransferase
MRIISGEYGGRTIRALKGMDVRPTTDKVRGAIFNMIGGGIIDARVLDLFSGSGAMGIEALSRGAREVVFVDCDTRCVNIITENLRSIGLSANDERTDVVKSDAVKSLGKFENKIFDIVVADPPYGKDLARSLLSDLEGFSIIRNSSIVFIEHSRRDTIEEPPAWVKVQEKKYGDTIVSVYKRKS